MFSIVRDNLMNEKGYTPYCGDIENSCRMPRSFFNGKQFECPSCGWQSLFPHSFIKKYKHHWNLTPYFCPLNKEFYFKVESGEQDCEIRPLNHRGWNEKNIYVGRDITFSNGYGKYNRTTKKTTETLVVNDLLFAVPFIDDDHIDAVKTIYPWADEWLVAYV